MTGANAPRVWTTKGPGLAGIVCARAPMPGRIDQPVARFADPRIEAEPTADVEIVLITDAAAVHLALCFASLRWPDVHVRTAEAIGSTPAEAFEMLRRLSPLPDLLANLQAWSLREVQDRIETAWIDHAGARRAAMEAAHG